MSIRTAQPSLAPACVAATPKTSIQHPAWIALASGCGLAALLTLPKTIQVASTGIFLNPDDAMRAVEVRDFMHGQAWFDLVPHRLSPDHPFAMHWSRLIDLPLTLVTRFFQLFLSPPNAELAMRLAVPSALFVISLWLMLRIVRDLVGVRALVPAALLLAGSGEFVANFIPGHIHHHAAQATLLLGATALTLRAFRQDEIAPAFWSGGLAALSLGIGVQNLPFIAALIAAVVLRWVGQGVRAASSLTGIGAGLAVVSPLVFLVDVPPSLYGAGACDAFSTAHLILACAGGGSLVLLAQVSARLPTVLHRVGAGILAGLLVIGIAAATYPACLRDPVAGIDPLLRTGWLADVGEALPLVRLIRLDPWGGAALVLTLVLGFAATVTAWHRSEPARRWHWAGLLVLAFAGLCGTLYQVRVAASTTAFLVPGVAWVALAIFDRLSRRPHRPALLAAVLLGLCGNGAAFAALAAGLGRLTPAAPALVSHQAIDPVACFEPANYATLAALPTGLVLSTIDPGSAILAATRHSVLAAPYHRNIFGIRTALLALNAPSTEAEALVRDAKADYVVLCRSSNETADSVTRYPDSLSADLLAGRTPPWLIPVDTASLILLYRVASSASR